MVVLVYIDNCTFFGKDSKVIDNVIEQLWQMFKLTMEDVKEDVQVNMFSYLGVQVTVNKTGIVTFKQQGLIQKVLKYITLSLQ